MNGEWRAESGHGETGARPVIDAGGRGEVGSERVEFEDVGAMGVGDLGNAESVGSDDI